MSIVIVIVSTTTNPVSIIVANPWGSWGWLLEDFIELFALLDKSYCAQWSIIFYQSHKHVLGEAVYVWTLCFCICVSIGTNSARDFLFPFFVFVLLWNFCKSLKCSIAGKRWCWRFFFWNFNLIILRRFEAAYSQNPWVLCCYFEWPWWFQMTTLFETIKMFVPLLYRDLTILQFELQESQSVFLSISWFKCIMFLTTFSMTPSNKKWSN